jgi:hypothetical protein
VAIARLAATLALLAVLSATAGAVRQAAGGSQAALSCTAGASPRTMRAEGLTELTGPIVITCTGGTPPIKLQKVPEYAFTVSLSAAATNRNGDAFLFVDNGRPRTATVTGNQLKWVNVPVASPGSTGSRVIRIRGIRLNASGLASANSPTPVQAALSVAGATTMTLQNPVVTVGFVQQGLSLAVANAADSSILAQPVTLPHCSSTQSVRIATLRFGERFATAFLARRTPGAAPQNSPTATYDGSESDYFDPAVFGQLGLADFGTRLEADFAGVPKDVTLSVEVSRSSATGSGYSAALTQSPTGPFSALPAQGQPAGTRPLAGGAATAADWEVVNAGSGFARFDFGVYATVTKTDSGPQPTAPLTVAGGLAPASTDTTASTGPVPRFSAKATSPPAGLLTLKACPTATTSTTTTTQTTQTAPVQTTSAPAPQLTELTFSPLRLRAMATISYRLSAPATVVFTVERAVKVHGKKRWVRVRGRFAIVSKAGDTRIQFNGRLAGKRLGPGVYRLLATPKTPSGSGAQRLVAFTVSSRR